MGILLGDLFPGPVGRFDHASKLFVEMAFGALQGISDLALLSGANALAVEGAPGVWDVLQFAAAELIAPRRYRLTRLLRGQRDTEDAMAAPASTGTRFIVLDDALAPLPVAELGLPFAWRVGPAAEPHGAPSYTAATFAAAGRGLRPFPVAHVAQPFRTARLPGDLAIRWTRRSRALSADKWRAVEVPLGEEAEAYEVEILDGAVVKRVLRATAPNAVYTAAQQTADWGRLLEPGDQLDIRIFQLSALVGRGAPKAVTLFL